MAASTEEEKFSRPVPRRVWQTMGAASVIIGLALMSIGGYFCWLKSHENDTVLLSLAGIVVGCSLAWLGIGWLRFPRVVCVISRDGIEIGVINREHIGLMGSNTPLSVDWLLPWKTIDAIYFMYRDGVQPSGAHIQVDLEMLTKGAGPFNRQRRLLGGNGNIATILWRGIKPTRSEFVEAICRFAPNAYIAHRPAANEELEAGGEVSAQRWTGRVFGDSDRLLARLDRGVDLAEWRAMDRSELV